MRISVKWRRFIWCMSWLVTASGIVVSFVSLPPLLAGLIAVILASVNYSLTRIGFAVSYFHKTPFPSKRVIDAKLGSLWAVEKNDDGTRRTHFGQVFATKSAALEAFRMLRSWNFGNYIDEEGNIVLRVIREELDRYTILLYPGTRKILELYNAMAKQQYGERAIAEVAGISSFFYTHADYWKRPRPKETVEALPWIKPVHINCFFVAGNDPKPVSRRALMISRAELLDRKDVTQGQMGFGLEWQDPWKGVDRNQRATHEHLFGDYELSDTWNVK